MNINYFPTEKEVRLLDGLGVLMSDSGATDKEAQQMLVGLVTGIMGTSGVGFSTAIKKLARIWARQHPDIEIPIERIPPSWRSEWQSHSYQVKELGR